MASPATDLRGLHTRAKLALSRKDQETAIAIYRELAQLGDVEGKCRLASLYHAKSDLTQAAEWFTRAAEQGSAEAQFMLGFLHRRGEGVSKDDITAAKFFRKAAEQGYVEAEEVYAQCLEAGIGMTANPKMAIEWYRRAADHGSSGALVHLGKYFSSGRETEPDFAQAFLYYARAAQHGDPEAQYELGLMYYDGRGVARDIEKALKWLSESSRRGYLVARRTMMYLPEFLERTSSLPQYNGTGVQVKRSQ